MFSICTYRPAPVAPLVVAAKATSYPAILQEWEESERGWGVRPDGATLHLSLEAHANYVAAFNRVFNSADEVPDEYRRVSGPARPVRVTPAAREALFAQLASPLEPEDAWRRNGIDLEAGMLVMLRRGAPGGIR